MAIIFGSTIKWRAQIYDVLKQDVEQNIWKQIKEYGT
jgi:hypothetical protein